jgi:hypothetical protein
MQELLCLKWTGNEINPWEPTGLLSCLELSQRHSHRSEVFVGADPAGMIAKHELSTKGLVHVHTVRVGYCVHFRDTANEQNIAYK